MPRNHVHQILEIRMFFFNYPRLVRHCRYTEKNNVATLRITPIVISHPTISDKSAAKKIKPDDPPKDRVGHCRRRLVEKEHPNVPVPRQMKAQRQSKENCYPPTDRPKVPKDIYFDPLFVQIVVRGSNLVTRNHLSRKQNPPRRISKDTKTDK